ncbi:MAG: Fic family protein [Minisyncoccales bacterium]
MKYEIIKPNLSKIDKPKVIEKAFGSRQKEITSFLEKINVPKYLYWDYFRYKKPIPEEFSSEELWFLNKITRKAKSIQSPIRDENGNYFFWIKLNRIEKLLHEIDMSAGGELFLSKGSLKNKQAFISRGVMEEAIASSQLEGASTSRRLAKEFLREGKSPKNESEQMILNNYLTMKAIEDEYKDRELSMDLIEEIHGMITKDVPTSDGEVARLREPNKDDDIVVSDDISGDVYHHAPRADFMRKELNRLISFANNNEEESIFIHPIIKAIMVHFWVGYLHPFTDGNGRLARWLFYWYLVKNKYWAFIYLPMSRVIKESYKDYLMAYVYSEQDENDMTYFVDFNIRKIEEAIREFNNYVKKKEEENLKMNKIAKNNYGFNDRQIQLLQYFYGSPEERTTLKTHRNIYQVSKATGIKDLKYLVKKGFLSSKKKGTYVYYYPTDSIKKLFQ